MPRIDPLQLLMCLSILLSPEGGILSRNEVPRLVTLMMKFSKKLVSKCVYVLILKNTESQLVDFFLAEGGWNLIHNWLQDAMQTANWDLVKEILSLLLVAPVDVKRLKLNIIPKLVKVLSRRDDLPGVQELATELVEHWLVIVKSNFSEPNNSLTETVNIAVVHDNTTKVVGEGLHVVPHPITTGTFYKLSVRDGKQIISKVGTGEEPDEIDTPAEDTTIIVEKKPMDKPRSSEKSKSSSSSKSSPGKNSSRSSSTSSTSSNSNRDKKKSSSSSSSKSSSSKDRSKDKSRDRKDRDKDKHRSNGSIKHSSSSKSSSSSSSKDRRDSKDSKEGKEVQAEKDKDTLAKIKPPSVDKLGRIPRKTSTDEKSKEKEVKKKPTMSIEVRKNTEDRPKTVKIFNSKMRSTGLEEEVKPPPPRTAAKKSSSVQLPTIPSKRPSPPPRESTLPEKKLKLEIPERPGSIKLIPPKPKPMLQESDIFMDALTASATAKKEPKKRKRRASTSKDTPSSPTSTTEPTPPPASIVTSPLGLKNIAPINFYQDTLTEESNADKENADDDNKIDEDRSNTPTDCGEDRPKDAKIPKLDGLKGVLLYTKKKGPKRSITWKSEEDLVEVRFFELDETERVNVTKNFTDMARMDISGEREALMSRKLANEDVMDTQTNWRIPYVIDQPDIPTVPGSKSLEKDIQFAREKSVLQALYFDKRKIPDSPEEAIPENHQVKDPVIIPLEDSDSQEIDLRNTPWPEPKGSPPHIEPQIPPQIFQNIPAPFNPNLAQLPPPAFQGFPPRFNGPAGPVGPGNFGPPNMMPNGNLMGPPNLGGPPDMMNHPHPGPMNPNMFGPGPGPDNFVPMNDNSNNFPMPFNQPNINMFPPNNFNMNRPGGGNRGGFRRGGNNNNGPGPWVRMNGPSNNWNRGGGGNFRGGGRLCKNVKNHGYCRNRDNCPFVHP